MTAASAHPGGTGIPPVSAQSPSVRGRRRLSRWVAPLLPALALAQGETGASRIEIGWPTANPAYLENRPIEAFVQPTVSGEVTSGLYGCVRTSGRQFHEAIDLKPASRDSSGEATDEIFAVLPGVVRHVNAVAGNSNYGRYIVLEHPDQEPAVYTLYAHLRSIRTGLSIGDAVQRSQAIGIMGRSAGGHAIPKDRAHLHFEIGLRLTDEFQPWYDWRKFGSRNHHGLWNGMNLVGVDPLEFYTLFREQRVDHFAGYFRELMPAVRVRIAHRGEPDFIRRYPVLRTDPGPAGGAAGWDVTMNAFGVPFAWTPLSGAEVAGMKRDAVTIVWTADEVLDACRCKDFVKRARGRAVPDRDLQTLLQLLFGLRR